MSCLRLVLQHWTNLVVTELTHTLVQAYNVNIFYFIPYFFIPYSRIISTSLGPTSPLWSSCLCLYPPSVSVSLPPPLPSPPPLPQTVATGGADLQDYMYYFTPAPWLSVMLLKMVQMYPAPGEDDALTRARLVESLDAILNRSQVREAFNDAMLRS